MNWCLLGVSHHLGPVWAVFARCPGLVLHHVLRFDCIVVGNLSHAPVISPIIGFCSLFCRISSKFRITDCLFFQGIIQRILTLKLLCLKGYTKQNAIKGQFCLPEATFLRHSSLPPVSSSFHLPQHSHFSSKKNQFTEHQFIFTWWTFHWNLKQKKYPMNRDCALYRLWSRPDNILSEKKNYM